jgi:prephenate dehydratase
MKRIAIQGQAASFHDIAARHFFGDSIQTINCDLPFRLTFESLNNDDVEYAVVAIENSLYGSINEVYDLLLEYKPTIIGEVYLHISQCLIGFPDTKISDIREVHSHPVALAQCEQYLDTVLSKAERFEANDTAGSVADIKDWGDATRAAIASKAAAKHHGMAILAEEIETNKQNYTRFVVLQKTQEKVENANKTSLILTMPTDTKAGALYRALGVFAQRDINLLMLQSRPIIGKAWHYLFYLDVAAAADETRFIEAVRQLEQQGCTATILGSYQNRQSTTVKA